MREDGRFSQRWSHVGKCMHMNIIMFIVITMQLPCTKIKLK